MGPYIGLAILAAFVALFLWIRRKQRDSAWRGTVVKISDHTEDSNEGFRYYKRVLYKTDEGKTQTWDVEVSDYKKNYPDLAVGDRLDKIAGEMMPRASKP